MHVPPDISLDQPEWKSELTKWIQQAGLILNGGIHSGDPAALIDNEDGQWVELLVAAASFFVQGTAAGAAVTFTHNLGLSLAGTDTLGSPTHPNVTWRVRYIRSGAARGPISFMYVTGDAIGTNSIELRPVCSAVPGGAITVALYFQSRTPR